MQYNAISSAATHDKPSTAPEHSPSSRFFSIGTAVPASASRRPGPRNHSKQCKVITPKEIGAVAAMQEAEKLNDLMAKLAAGNQQNKVLEFKKSDCLGGASLDSYLKKHKVYIDKNKKKFSFPKKDCSLELIRAGASKIGGSGTKFGMYTWFGRITIVALDTKPAIDRFEKKPAVTVLRSEIEVLREKIAQLGQLEIKLEAEILRDKEPLDKDKSKNNSVHQSFLSSLEIVRSQKEGVEKELMSKKHKLNQLEDDFKKNNASIARSERLQQELVRKVRALTSDSAPKPVQTSYQFDDPKDHKDVAAKIVKETLQTEAVAHYKICYAKNEYQKYADTYGHSERVTKIIDLLTSAEKASFNMTKILHDGYQNGEAVHCEVIKAFNAMLDKDVVATYSELQSLAKEELGDALSPEFEYRNCGLLNTAYQRFARYELLAQELFKKSYNLEYSDLRGKFKEAAHMMSPF